MLGNTYVFFVTVFVVVIFFEYDFCTKDHIICDVAKDDLEYTELFCMARTENLKTEYDGAYLRNYGRWQFYIIIQMFIGAICCRIDLKMNQLKSEEEGCRTIGKRYILATAILLGIIICWTLSYFSLGGYFNIFIKRLVYHAVDVRAVQSPIATVFPRAAECIVEPLMSNETFVTTCELPLNTTAPFYFMILFVVYMASFLRILSVIVNLAWEKILETRQRVDLEAQKIEKPAKVPEKPLEDPILKILARKLKHWTKPRGDSSMKAPLIQNFV